LDAYEGERERTGDAFRRRLEGCRNGEGTELPPPPDASDSDEEGGDEEGGDEQGGDEQGGDEQGGDEQGGDEQGGDEVRNDKPHRIPRALHVAGHEIVAFSLVCPLDDPEREFLVRFYGCFESMAEADAWGRNTASKLVTEYDMHFARVRQWIDPRLTSDAPHVKCNYRNPELDRIMKTWKDQQA
jgi:hypothetical protein